MPVPHRTIRGTLAYTSNQPERLGQQRGRERFSITVHGDGRRTLRSQCEIDDPPPVLRDVTLSLNPHWQPTDCFVRVTVGDAFVGSSWFRFGERQIECEGYTAREGRISQTMEIPGRVDLFVTHPIQADAWLVHAADLAKVGQLQHFPSLHLCSLDHRGATGPMLMHQPGGFSVTFLGRETITVKAGTFDALHYRIGGEVEEKPEETANEPGKHPRYEIWCTADGDQVFLKAWVSGYMMTAYELVELQRS